METLTSSLTQVLYSVPYFAVLLGILWVAKLAYDAITPFKFKEQLVGDDAKPANPAFGTHYALWMIGLAIALSGALYGSLGSATGDVADLQADMVNIGVYGFECLILVWLSILVNDKFILKNFKIEKELIEDRNVGTAFVTGGAAVATGLMLNGALNGESSSMVRGVVDLGVYWVVGQAILVAAGLVFQKITSYDIHHELEERDNPAVGLSFGGFLVATGLITRTSLVGASSELLPELITTLCIGAAGLVLLGLSNKVCDLLFLPSVKLDQALSEKKNMSAAAVSAAISISVGICFAFAIAASAV